MPAPSPLSPAHPAWPRAVPFALFISLMMVEPVLEPWIGGVLDPRWLYAVRSALTALALVYFWRRYVELREAPPLRAGPILAAIGVGLAVFVLWIFLDFPPLVVGGEGDGFDPRVSGQVHWGFAVSRLAGSALVVPIMEELFWRSWIMRWLQQPRFLAVDPKDVGWKALAISSVVFAAEHNLWFAGLLAGLAYGELYRRTGDIRLATLAHAVTNGVLGVWIIVTANWQFW